MKATNEQTTVDKFAAEHTKFDWDCVTSWTPTWQDIQGKAHLYKTAQRRSDGEFISLRGLVRVLDGLELVEPAFRAYDKYGAVIMATDDLCNFCL